MKRFQLIATCSLTLVLGQVAFGATYYVSTGGSDSANGAQATPWKTVQKAASTAVAGDTVNVLPGVYNEIVTVAHSGTSGNPITFTGQTGAIIDGTGKSAGGDQIGLISLIGLSYVTVQGFEIRNFSTSSANDVPCGIWITGSGSGLKILNNKIHDIVTNAGASGNAFGMATYGSETAPIDGELVDGNELYNMKTGESETMTFNGNVSNFLVTNNIVHDNNNIGIDAIGFENTGPSGHDFANNGVIRGNTVYNISGINNPGEGNSYDADGIYVDGGSNITIENNILHHNDINIEAASEHAGKTTGNILIRNNLAYLSNSMGITIGGYDNKRGASDHITMVNNTLLQNDTKNTGSGEFQVQYFTTNSVFENNIVYSGAQKLLVNNYTNSEPTPVTMNNNIYYTPGGAAGEFVWNGTSHSGLAAHQTASGQDANSKFVDPKLVNLTTPDLHTASGSPAIDGGIELGSAVEGTTDFAGSARVQGARIDIGAYESGSAVPPPPPPPTGASKCDANADGSTNVSDVQMCVTMALGTHSCTADVNGDGVCNVADVQRVVNAALGGACVTTP